MARRRFIAAMGMLLYAGTAAYGLDLFGAYSLGLQNDPLVLQAEADRNAAQKYKPIGLAGLLPSVVLNFDTDGMHSNTGKSPYVGQSNTDYFYQQATFHLTLTQPLFRYASWVTYWQADYQLAQAQAKLEAEYQNLGVRVAKAYFEVLYAEDVMEFTTIQLKSLELEVSQVQERLNLGFSTIVDLEETQSRKDKVAADLIQAEQKMFDAREALREITGTYEESLAKVVDALPLIKPEPDNIDIWSDFAQQGNLGILAATSAAEVAKHVIDFNYAGHLPTIDATADQYSTENNRPTGAYQLNQQSIGLNVSLPIYQGGAVSAKVDKARDEYEKSLHEVDRLRRATQRAVKDSFRGVTAMIGRIIAMQAAVKSAQGALEAAKVGYQVGNKTIVNVLWQQSLYFQYWADYARARYDYLINSVSLKQAAGTLVQSDMDALNKLMMGKVLKSQQGLKMPGVPKLEVVKRKSSEPPLVGGDPSVPRD